MADKIKGILIEIGGDTSGLQKALKDANSRSSDLTKELKGINTLLKFDPKNTELLAQKQTVLNKNIEATQQSLNELKKIKEEADKKIASGTELSEEGYRNLQREIVNTERKLTNLTQELKDFNLVNLKLTKAGKVVEEYGNKISKASSKLSDLGNKASVLSATTIAGGTALTNSAMNLESAISKYMSSTNVAKEETEKYRDVLENIYNKNYGENYEDIANSMVQVKNQLKDLDSQNLQNVTEKALALRDIFGYDVSESVRAVKALMDNFNISADEAFNLISQGKQQGLDFSNEMLDNVNEYSVQFKKLGLTADDMFNIFKVGAENGAFNLDKIGDAVKEFSIRAIDGSNTTIDGFNKLGLNANNMAKKFAEGGDVAKQAFIEVINRIGKMDDKVKQSIVGVDLFGTMWEDLGPTVVTSFNKMNNGISKSNNSMQKSIDEQYNTTQKKAEAQLKRLKSIGADFGKEMLPTLEKLIDMVEGFTKSLEGMSDAEKENILKIAALVVGFGPFTKTIGTAGKVIGDTSKGIGLLSQAMGVLKTGGTATSKSVGTLVKILGGLTSPVGIGVLAVGALAGAIAYLNNKGNESVKATKELAEEMAKSKKEMEDYRNDIDKNTNANLSHMDSVTKLRNELKELVDENGKVKQGYEGRVSFILNELNSALGTEYKLNDGIIEKYKELQGEIDTLIKKKKAQIVLQGEEEKYKNAIENQREAVEELKKAQEKLGMSYEEAKKKCEDYNNAREKLYGSKQGEELTEDEYNVFWHSRKKEIESLENLVSAYESAEGRVKTYTETTNKYADLFAKYQQGKFEEVANIVTVTTENWTSKALEELNNSITEQSKILGIYKNMYERTGNEIALNNSQQAQKNLDDLANELATRTQTLDSLGQDEIEAWKNIAEQSYSSYSIEISKMSPEMQKKIQEVTGIIAAGTPQMQEKAEELGRKTIEEFDKSSDAKQKALNTITGYLNGLTDEQKRELLKQAGIEDIDAVLEELNKGELSEEHGRNILKGLWKGLKDGTWRDKIVGTASGLAEAVNKAFTGKKGWDEHSPSKKMQKYAENYVQPISDVMKKRQSTIVANAQELANKINSKFSGSFKEADMSNFSKNLNGSYIKNSNKNISNINNINFNVQELDQAKLEQCFNYVNKKFGTLY